LNNSFGRPTGVSSQVKRELFWFINSKALKNPKAKNITPAVDYLDQTKKIIN
jgi:hypothetical protein